MNWLHSALLKVVLSKILTPSRRFWSPWQQKGRRGFPPSLTSLQHSDEVQLGGSVLSHASQMVCELSLEQLLFASLTISTQFPTTFLFLQLICFKNWLPIKTPAFFEIQFAVSLFIEKQYKMAGNNSSEQITNSSTSWKRFFWSTFSSTPSEWWVRSSQSNNGWTRCRVFQSLC